MVTLESSAEIGSFRNALLCNVMKRWALGFASVAVLAVLAEGILILVDCTSEKVTECNYGKLKIGMKVSEAEVILGPGQERAKEAVPERRWPNGMIVRAVSGDRFFNWYDRATAREVWVGVRNGKICDKWYWQPSF